MMAEKLYPLTLRIWHWVNTGLVFLLIVTGIQLRAPDVSLFLSYRNAVLLHKYAGFGMAASFLFWLVYTIASGSVRRHYLFRAKDLKGTVRQIEYYVFGLFLGWDNPFHATPQEKFNALQKMAYSSVMVVFTPIMVVTGILFSDITFFRDLMLSLGGIRMIDTIHVIGAYTFVCYLIIHVYMSTVGPTPFSHTKEMFTGREEQHEQ
jgi:thiosulfate reductase cytochrome b subunit